MARKKIKLITFDLDDTIWPNQKVIIDAEKALWNFLLMKVPHVRDELNEKNINRIRVELVEKDNSCLLYTSPSPRDMRRSRMPSSA